MLGSQLLANQVLELSDPEMNDTSTKIQSTHCTQSFTIDEDDCLNEGLNDLMVKMTTQEE